MERQKSNEIPSNIQYVRRLVLRYGWNTTAYQILNPGIPHWLSVAGDAVIGFVEHKGVRIVAGAPVCAKERLAEVAAEFERTSAARDCRVCYFCAESRLEAALHDSKEHSRVRCLQQWLATRSFPPLHFLVEPMTLERLYDRRVFVAERGGEVIGFVVASPVPLRNGWLIEQIIRGKSAVNGTSEIMIDAAVKAMDESGSEYITLGLSPLSRRAEMHLMPNPLWLRLLLGWVRAHGRRFYNFDGLDAFKAKFQPEKWEPVFAISNEAQFSPLTLYAIASAFTESSPIRAINHAILKALGTEVGWLRAKLRRN